MKTNIAGKALMSALLVLVSRTVLFAQDATGSGSGSTTEVNITTDTGNWFSQPWVWVVGAIIFIILLVALMGGGSSRRTTTTVRRDGLGGSRVTRTTTTDDDV